MKANYYFKIYFLILLSLLTFVYTKDENIEYNDNSKENLNNETVYEMPRTTIQVDQIILGSLSTKEIDDNCISELYEVTLPQDSEKIEFDLQSSLINIYISVGESPMLTKDNSDFILHNPGRDSVLTLEKTTILEALRKKKISTYEEDSLENIKLLIGLSSDKKDSTEYMLYSLRIHQPINKSNNLDIIKITSDHKIICKPQIEHIDNKDLYRCLFLIDYNTMYNPSSIIIHGFSSNPGAKVNLFGSFIDRDIYDFYDLDNLTQLIPNENNAEYNTKNDNVNYIYISELPKNKYLNYLYISLYSDSPEDLILLNSIPLPVKESAYQININAYSEQLILYNGNNLILYFPGTEGITADIEVLSGEGEIKWENSQDKFSVKGSGDRLTLFSDKNNRRLVITQNKKELNSTIKAPGFLFYINYNARKNNYNFDEIKFGKSTELSYNNINLPAVLYCNIEIEKIKNGLNIAITFKDDPINIEVEYEETPITLLTTIIEEEELSSLKQKKNISEVPSKINTTISGYYDPSIKTALIHISQSDIETYKFNKTKNYILYLHLDKLEKYKDIIYSKLNIEVQVIGINDDIIPIDNVYHYGKLDKNKNEIFYPLKISKNKKFMKIQIAFNSDNINYAINEEKNKKENQTFDDQTSLNQYGKNIITFKAPDNDILYLNIFSKEKVIENDELNNYVFKYQSGISKDDFYEYKLSSPNITIEEMYKINKDTVSLKCAFNQIQPNIETAKITYLLKIVDNSSYIKGEEINTISVTQSPSFVYFKRNPKPNEDYDPDIISLETKGNFSNFKYIELIAQIIQNNDIEYITYNEILNNNINMISIKIKIYKDTINLGQKAVLILDTYFNDTEKNLFNDPNINFEGQFSVMNNTYKADCSFFKPNKDNMKIICKFNQKLISGTIKFIEKSLVYKGNTIQIISNDYITINQLNYDIAVLYSEKQEINIDNNNKYYLKFKKVLYNNEQLILYQNEFKLINLDCEEQQEELTCNFEKDKILKLLSTNVEQFNLYQRTSSDIIIKIESVSDILIHYENQDKINIALNITKLLTQYVEKNTFVIYETNITDMPGITGIITNYFNIFSNRNDETKCFFKAVNQNNEKLLLLCEAGNNKVFTLGDLPSRNISDISILYDFIMPEIKNDEICNVSEKEGAIIYSVNPNELDYNNKDPLIVQYQTDYPERLKGIKLNNDSSSELECTNKNKIKECIVPSNHFSKSGLYYTYYNNSLGMESIIYEIPTIKISLKEQKTNTDSSDPESDSSDPESDSNLVGIIVGSVIGGLVVIGIVLFLIVRTKRKRKNDFNISSNFSSDLKKEQEQNLVPNSLHVELKDEGKFKI